MSSYIKLKAAKARLIKLLKLIKYSRFLLSGTKDTGTIANYAGSIYLRWHNKDCAFLFGKGNFSSTDIHTISISATKTSCVANYDNRSQVDALLKRKCARFFPDMV